MPMLYALGFTDQVVICHWARNYWKQQSWSAFYEDNKAFADIKSRRNAC